MRYAQNRGKNDTPYRMFQLRKYKFRDFRCDNRLKEKTSKTESALSEMPKRRNCRVRFQEKNNVYDILSVRRLKK